MVRPSLCIVTPALASSNNGNWQTALRWSKMLREHYRIALVDHWDGTPADVMIALHARRSAASIERWCGTQPHQPLAVVLTGTDLYRDIQFDASAQRSLALADRLVVLHERAVDDLPVLHRDKATACFQSTRSLAPLRKPHRHLRALMVGHLRAEKAPQTYFAAARRLVDRPDILLDHIGAALDPAWSIEAKSAQQACPAYRWLGPLPHADARRRIQAAHVLVHPSVIEGGAHVVMEAVCSGTPVLASRIAGNIGMLGEDYGGYFELGDSEALAALLQRCRDEPAMLDRLAAQCASRAPLFEPALEQATLLALLCAMIGSKTSGKNTGPYR
ncbi:selenoneine biosynthesis selenosugar synthase SenB [Variovorax sp. RTB1]|uniref:selenoneine biosynthesis selenosugar synthase SenB n=1 Tax=Variovorax sp. RTB1 TaxID=3048631 RepID=UPI002B23AB0D|nr:selenoneine biosynthesis selenosugar synthase SenB [Variovorax sp. RTB1]MEB0112469.1 selenoneine biosynthesis selenosugar synthase SenB [Variovorax sp. RTB1]